MVFGSYPSEEAAGFDVRFARVERLPDPYGGACPFIAVDGHGHAWMTRNYDNTVRLRRFKSENYADAAIQKARANLMKEAA